MITANNGVLLVLLVMAVGWREDNRLLVAAAICMASLAYVVNVAIDNTWPPAVLTSARWTCVAVGTAAIAYALVLTLKRRQ